MGVETHPLESHDVAVGLCERNLLPISEIVDNRHDKITLLWVKARFVNDINLQCRPHLAKNEKCHPGVIGAPCSIFETRGSFRPISQPSWR